MVVTAVKQIMNIYIMRDGEWFVTSGDMTGVIELRTALKQLETV